MARCIINHLYDRCSRRMQRFHIIYHAGSQLCLMPHLADTTLKFMKKLCTKTAARRDSPTKPWSEVSARVAVLAAAAAAGTPATTGSILFPCRTVRVLCERTRLRRPLARAAVAGAFNATAPCLTRRDSAVGKAGGNDNPSDAVILNKDYRGEDRKRQSP